MKKRVYAISAVLLVVLLCVGMCACSGNNIPQDGNLAYQAKVVESTGSNAASMFDSKKNTYWVSDGELDVNYVTVELGAEIRVKQIRLFEKGDNVRYFEIYAAASGKDFGETPVYKGTTIGDKVYIDFTEKVVAKRLKLVIANTYSGNECKIAEMGVY